MLVAAGAIVLVASSDHTTDKLPTILLAVPTALAFVASGIIARSQRPSNAIGILLIVVGFAWALGALTTANNEYVFTAGLLLGTVFTAMLAHLFLAFPTGRLTNRTDRRIVGLFYAVVLVGPLLVFLFDEGEVTTTSCDGPCPENVLSLVGAQPLATAIAIVYAVGSLALATLVLVRMIQRWRRASPALRRTLAPVFVSAAVLIAVAVFQSIVGFFSEELARAINWLTLAAVLAVPLSFLYGLLRSRFTAATRRLVAELSEKRRPVEVQAVLRRALRDPDLELGYRAGDGYVDVDGEPLALPAAGEDRVFTTVAGEVIVHDAALRDQPELDEVLDAVHIAMERGVSLGSLESSERRATALLEAIPDSMYRVAADGTFIEFRLSETARLPIDADDLVGMNVRDVLSPKASDDVFAAMKRAAANDTVEVVNYTLDFAGDPRRYLEARIVKSGEDESVAIVRDITERTLQQQALESLAEGRAALSRVAVAVATAATAEPVFAVVTEEVGRLFGANASNLIRFDRQDENAGLVVGRWSELAGVISPVGTQIELLGGAVTQVRRTGRPARARVPDIARTEPALVERLQELGITSFVASPIEVSGELWGAVVVWRTGDEEFAEDVGERLVQFGKLVAVAVANAEAREQLAGLAAEQAALSRVAVAVATASRPEVLFDTVTEEVARRLGADAANLVRFEPRTNEGVIVGKWSEPGVKIPGAGTRVELFGGALERVFKTGRPARGGVDDPGNSPALVARLKELGVTSLVAAPIEVSGELWGAVVVSVTGDQTFAADAEERIGQFASLVAVALANAEAREQLSNLAEEQAALSRVAVAVATASAPEVLFNVVTEEVALRLGSDAANLIRFDPRNTLEGIVVGRWSNYEADFASIGTRVQLTGGPVTAVRRTGRPARGHIDDPEITPSALVDQLRERGVRSMVASPIEVSGQLWGAVVVTLTGDRTFAPDAERRMGQFASLVAVALANAEAREELTASRARIVQAGDAARRRLERNLHDGAQQRLVTLSLTLRLAQARLDEDAAASRELLDAASGELAAALEELRELARGLHPAILSDRGLGAALEALATRAPVPVELGGVPPERLPPPVEAAAYYVVAESLTNVAKYAEASTAHVSVVQDNGFAIVEVVDDGVGGVDLSRGSGLRGLADRVEALEGRLTVTSEAGRGTRVRAEIPC
jgi:signal transduction histidine kinase/MFS family permease